MSDFYRREGLLKIIVFVLTSAFILSFPLVRAGSSELSKIRDPNENMGSRT